MVTGDKTSARGETLGQSPLAYVFPLSSLVRPLAPPPLAAATAPPLRITTSLPPPPARRIPSPPPATAAARLPQAPAATGRGSGGDKEGPATAAAERGSGAARSAQRRWQRDVAGSERPSLLPPPARHIPSPLSTSSAPSSGSSSASPNDGGG